MSDAIRDRPQVSAPEGLLLAVIASIPLMKPAVAYPIVLPDLVFVPFVALLAREIALGRLAFRPGIALAVLLVYVLGMVPSLATTPDLGQSAYKLSTEVYLASLALAVIVLVRSKAFLKVAIRCWLAATACLVLLAMASLVAFFLSPGGPLYAYSLFHFGTLPPGDYPRLSLTFLNANMACNYLTVSLGLLFVAWQQGWLGPRLAWALMAGIIVAAGSTLSPGLGGVALALGTGFWLLRGSRLALAAGLVGALAFLAAAAVTPIIHPTAPFVFEVAGQDLAPSGRFLTWSAALAEFLRHPLAGHGIGIDAVEVVYVDPSGNVQHLTDAHNLVLSIAAQTGLAGLAGLGLLVAYVARLSLCQGDRDRRMCLGLGCTFLNAFVYQGMTGAFEDTRHLWLLLGLLVAAARLPVTRPDGNNRRFAGQWPG